MINNLFDRFHALPFSKDVIGLGWSDSDVTYFCTRIGAEVIGWLGVVRNFKVLDILKNNFKKMIN